jgi:membrane fusion protein (multidrug efflux system)
MSCGNVEVRAMAYRENYSESGYPRRVSGGPIEGAPRVAASAPAGEMGRAPVIAPDGGEASAAEASKAPAGAAPAAAKPKKSWGKRLAMFTILAGAAGFGGYEGYGWWTNGRFMVSTDDAYVQADITQLAAKVSGYVQAVPVGNNQPVKAGDVIARIDDGDYRLALQAAKDKLATQQATIARVGRQAEAGRAQVVQAEAQLMAAQADAERATSDFERQTQLAQSGYNTQARLDQVKADRDRTAAAVQSAQAAVSAARANVDVLLAQQGEAQRVAAELQTAAARAERDLTFTVVRAPVDGVVGNKAVEVGTFVQPGARLAAVVPLANVHIDANFKETQLASLLPGQRVHIEVDAFPGREIAGTVQSLSPASGSVFSLLPAENATGNFTKIVQRVPVRVAVDPEIARQGLLRPGLSVTVTVDRRDRPQGVDNVAVARAPEVAAPASAVQAPAEATGSVAPRTAAPAPQPTEAVPSKPEAPARPETADAPPRKPVSRAAHGRGQAQR